MDNRYPLTIYDNGRPVEIRDEAAWEQFSCDFTLIHAAGGIVSDGNGDILMIHRLGCWDFPKGKVEAGEDWPTAALREVEEETGLHDISLHEPLPNTYHTYTLHGAPILKITHWYEMHAPQQSLTPQTEEDISQAVWVPRTEVADHLKESYLSLKKLWGELAVSS
jgi:ADP-ribose pyrophosphatase YjhB (NUDIX family)